jgi:hypothetical protein
MSVIWCNFLNLLHVKMEIDIASRHTQMKEMKADKEYNYVTDILWYYYVILMEGTIK